MFEFKTYKNFHLHIPILSKYLKLENYICLKGSVNNLCFPLIFSQLFIFITTYSIRFFFKSERMGGDNIRLAFLLML